MSTTYEAMAEVEVGVPLGPIRCWWRSQRLDRPARGVGGSLSTEVAATLIGNPGERVEVVLPLQILDAGRPRDEGVPRWVQADPITDAEVQDAADLRASSKERRDTASVSACCGSWPASSTRRLIR